MGGGQPRGAGDNAGVAYHAVDQLHRRPGAHVHSVGDSGAVVLCAGGRPAQAGALAQPRRRQPTRRAGSGIWFTLLWCAGADRRRPDAIGAGGAEEEGAGECAAVLPVCAGAVPVHARGDGDQVRDGAHRHHRRGVLAGDARRGVAAAAHLPRHVWGVVVPAHDPADVRVCAVGRVGRGRVLRRARHVVVARKRRRVRRARRRRRLLPVVARAVLLCVPAARHRRRRLPLLRDGPRRWRGVARRRARNLHAASVREERGRGGAAGRGVRVCRGGAAAASGPLKTRHVDPHM
mmetsp:Transcript_40216/g.119891  ORF Transcript_40216/g.119891 Transcript_40216/m.119891 type:complete len:291 (+) Transcript_40216:1096-1968(+)